MTCTERQFLKEVSGHEMRVRLDNGVYRNVLFKIPGTSNRWFEITTWPGTLCIDGDMGTYVFSRIEDMFKFFRGDTDSLVINESYWAEKLQAHDCGGKYSNGVEVWSPQRFGDAVELAYDEYIEANDLWETDRAAELWGEIECDIFRHSAEQHDAMTAVRDFESDGFTFTDFNGTFCMDWDHHFVWCLYAIVWGIQQYDARPQSKIRRLFQWIRR